MKGNTLHGLVKKNYVGKYILLVSILLLSISVDVL